MNGEKIEQIIREKIQTYQQQEISLTQNIYRVKGAVKALELILKAVEQEEEEIMPNIEQSEG